MSIPGVGMFAFVLCFRFDGLVCLLDETISGRRFVYDFYTFSIGVMFASLKRVVSYIRKYKHAMTI